MLNKLKFYVHNKVGRNRGRISSFHRGGGVKKLYRVVDFWRYLTCVKGKVVALERDPNRTAPLALILFSNKIFSYVIASNKLKIGDFVENVRSDKKYIGDLVEGNSYILKQLPDGSKVFNLEFFPNTSGKIARSAGTFCILVKKYSKFGLVKLVSGEYRLFSLNCRCNLGRVGNIGSKNKKFIKAGQKRYKGRRPVVRGRAMNPVDHPHGGRTNGGITPRTPWGSLAIGPKTRKKKQRGGLIVKRRRK